MRFATVEVAASGPTQPITVAGFGGAAEILGAVLLVVNTEGGGAPVQVSWGTADAALNQWSRAFSAYGLDLGDPYCQSTFRDTHAIAMIGFDAGSADVAVAEVTAIVDNGVELTWTGAVGAWTVRAMIFGDDGGDAYAVGSGIVDQLTGLTATPGFETDAVHCVSGGPPGANTPGVLFSMGAVVPPDKGGAMALVMDSDADPAVTRSWGAEGNLCCVTATSGAVQDRVSVGAVTATQIDFATSGVGDVQIGWGAFLCPNQVPWAGAPLLDGSSTGAKPVATGAPTAAYIGSVVGSDADDSLDPRCGVSIGLWSAATAGTAIGAESEDGETPPGAEGYGASVAVRQPLPAGGDWRVGDIVSAALGYDVVLSSIAGTNQDSFVAPALVFGPIAASGGRRPRLAYRSQRSRTRHVLVS